MGVTAYLFAHQPKLYLQAGRMRDVVAGMEGRHTPDYESLRTQQGIDAPGLRRLLQEAAHIPGLRLRSVPYYMFVAAAWSVRYPDSRFTLASEFVLSHDGAISHSMSSEAWQEISLDRIGEKRLTSYRRDWSDVVGTCPTCAQDWVLPYRRDRHLRSVPTACAQR